MPTIHFSSEHYSTIILQYLSESLEREQWSKKKIPIISNGVLPTRAKIEFP